MVRSPGAISQKREFSKYRPETFDDIAPETTDHGAWRLAANSQKPAIGEPFCQSHGHIL
jgi:hypothetical protein